MTNVSPQMQRMPDNGFRDMRHKNERAANRPPALVHNHLHGSDMFIRNQLSGPEGTTMPPKFQRTMSPSPSGYDSDYFSTSSRGSAITPPPFARANMVGSPDPLHYTELPHRMDYPLTSPPHSAGGRYVRSSSSHQFTTPRPVNGANRKPRTRRRHSSVETSVDGIREVVEQNSMHHGNTMPSRPQSSASNVREQVVSNRLNRHKSYYEAVTNEAVTSQTIFSYRSERIQTLPEEMSGLNDSEGSTVVTDNTVCPNGIDLDMTSQAQSDVHYPSHDCTKSHQHRTVPRDELEYCPQSDSELVTSSRNYPRHRGNGVQASPPMNRQVDATHPRRLNSTNPPSPLQISQRSSPKLQHHQFDSTVQNGSPQLQSRHRHFSCGDSHPQQQANERCVCTCVCACVMYVYPYMYILMCIHVCMYCVAEKFGERKVWQIWRLVCDSPN